MEQAGSYCEVVSIFDSFEALQAAADSLLTHGLNPSDLSLLANEYLVEEKLGYRPRSITELADNEKTPRVAYNPEENIGAAQGGIIGGFMYVSTLAAAGIAIAGGGPLSAVLGSAMLTGGAGTLIGVYLSRLIGKHHADYLESQLKLGGLLLWVRLNHPEDEEKITAALKENGAKEVHTHCIPTSFYDLV